ncbi:hypothetical protein NEILACOT_03028 [Neisseria lactamica ATCC 23970]|uniref:Uncharacterized protein n=1 Tax=Neisseria lactamica ATCC 23970 TaxID=546265 RepID=D0W692_NEILA|nr:hypothetical protein NEILACOT_03028 [Neisseria lactamica ATCC 23970]
MKHIMMKQGRRTDTSPTTRLKCTDYAIRPREISALRHWIRKSFRRFRRHIHATLYKE